MVSMKDIAEQCGVSVATVSKALNGHSDIGEATKERIVHHAEALGYMTNSAARALKTNRTYNIGVLFVDEQNSGLTHEYFSSVLDSLKVEAESSGYDITFINRNVGARTTTYLQHCIYRGVDGVVIACVDFDNPQVMELVSSGIPIVTIDHVFNNKIAVVSDNALGLSSLTEHVAGKGHRKISFIHGELTAVTKSRLTGFYRTCERLGIEVPDEYVVEGRYHDTATCYRETMNLLGLPDRPTCILFPDDFSAIGGLNAIRDAGLKIPEDISVAGYDGINLSRVTSPVLTTYKQDTAMLGMAAASKLIELIEHPKTAILDRTIIQGHLLDGDSVRDLNDPI